jgi:tetratricopeptide (TPR) repeat protein
MSPAADDFARAWELHRAGDRWLAEEAYRLILQREPRDGRTWFVLGHLCLEEGRLAEATALFRQALEIAPREPMGHLHLGNVLMQQAKYAEAEAAYRRCLELEPGHTDALVNRGFALGELRRLDEARGCYEEALRLNPGLAEVHHNLGNVHREQGRFDPAMACYAEALRLRPDYAKAFINRGLALVARGKVEEAVANLRRGVELSGAEGSADLQAQAHSSLGTALSSQGRLDVALEHYEQAIPLKPDYADAHWNRGLVRLLRGDYERGWPDYEWRWRTSRHFPFPDFPQPRWDGSPLEGRAILLYAEQGLGDTLQFIRYAPLVRARAGKVVVQCQQSLLPLLARSPGIDQFLAWGQELPPFDVYVPLMSLPALLHTTLETIPAEVPYLFADPQRVGHWRRELAPLAGLRVGIVWQGSTQHAWDRHRSVPLSLFEPLARMPGVHLISLQRGQGAE